MTATLFRLHELLYEFENSFLENAQTPGSNTYSSRIPIISAQCTLEQPRETDQTVQSRKNESRPGFLGLRTGTLEFVTYVPGLTVDPGASFADGTWAHDLMTAGLIGAQDVSIDDDDGGTVSGSPSPTATQFTVSGISQLTAGAVIRVGVKNDGGGDGQSAVVSTFATNVVTLLTALPAAPAAAAAVRATSIVYPTEDNPSTTLRFLLGFTTAGAQFHAMGCQLDSISDEIDVAGGRPVRRTWRYRIAYWARTTVSIPSAVAMPSTDTAPIAGGSLFVQTFGTATRAIEECGAITLSLEMGLTPQMGPAAGQAPYTNITGWVSNGCIPTLTWSIPWLAQPETDFDLDGSGSTVFKHALFTTNGTVGRCQGFYLPRMFPVGNRPTYTNQGGLLYTTKTMRGTESTTTTNSVTRSVIRFFMG